MIGAFGAGMNQAPMLAEFVRRTDLDVLLVAGRYTLLDQPALDELLPLCLDRGVRVVAGGVFNGGILATAEPGRVYDYAEAPRELVERAEPDRGDLRAARRRAAGSRAGAADGASRGGVGRRRRA